MDWNRVQRRIFQYSERQNEVRKSDYTICTKMVKNKP